MERYFTITTNHKVALQIIDFFKSKVSSQGRCIKLGQVNHEKGYSVVQILFIEGKEPKLSDIFFLGYFSYSNKVEGKFNSFDCFDNLDELKKLSNDKAG